MTPSDRRKSPLWTPEQDAALLAKRGASERELARLASNVGPTRTPTAARKRLKKLLERIDVNGGSAWAKAERELLERLYPTTSDPDLVQALKAGGFKRSVEGVKRARQRYGYLRERKNEFREQQPGWAPLPGEDDDRDTKFVRLVLTEALRLGLCRKTTTITREPLKALAGEVGAA